MVDKAKRGVQQKEGYASLRMLVVSVSLVVLEQ